MPCRQHIHSRGARTPLLRAVSTPSEPQAIRHARVIPSTSEGICFCRSHPRRTLKLMADAEIQFVSDERGETTAVIVPISLWREIESERQTRYLLKSDAMKRRLLEAKDREEGIPIEAAIEKLGL
jgi:hypothetical protein